MKRSVFLLLGFLFFFGLSSYGNDGDEEKDRKEFVAPESIEESAKGLFSDLDSKADLYKDVPAHTVVSDYDLVKLRKCGDQLCTSEDGDPLEANDKTLKRGMLIKSTIDDRYYWNIVYCNIDTTDGQVIVWTSLGGLRDVGVSIMENIVPQEEGVSNTVYMVRKRE